MIPIEKAVHARLVREGLERARSSPDSEAAEDAPDAEGRLTRAGRCTSKTHCPHRLCFTPAVLAPCLYLKRVFTMYPPCEWALSAARQLARKLLQGKQP